jgi:hypothetical protein
VALTRTLTTPARACQKLYLGNTVASAQREMMDRIDWLDPACVDRLPQASEAQNSEGMAQ